MDERQPNAQLSHLVTNYRSTEKQIQTHTIRTFPLDLDPRLLQHCTYTSHAKKHTV